MPIKGLHSKTISRPGLARAGIIRLGYRAKQCEQCQTEVNVANSNCPTCASRRFSEAFPRESAHFILRDAPGLAEILGTETPTELNIYFMEDQIDQIFPRYMDYWNASALTCRGDGEIILYAINPKTGQQTVDNGWVTEEFYEDGKIYKVGELMPCSGKKRDLYPKCQWCKGVGTLFVGVREVPRLAYYQISTSSWYNLIELARQLEKVSQLVEELTGQPRLSGVPFILRRVKRVISAPSRNSQGRQPVEKYLLQLEIEPKWAAELIAAKHREVSLI